jgi:site-specific DNA-methyltransferase (adenine-specific)
MNGLPAGSVDLAFADPPFNIGYDYDVYDDSREHEQYLDWSRQWIGAVHRALKPTGTFWLAIGDEYAAELKLISREIGFHCRSWVVWYYTFGVNCTRKFTRSHAHLFHFVKDPAQFTFRSDEPENRVPSARQLVYADARANPKGRLADDTWILRPQDATGSFTTMEDTWYFPRVAGTFKERAGFHGCQMPEQLLGRIIRMCSEPGELVLDPFSGSASTLSVARKLGRDYLGFDVSAEYIARGRERLAAIRVGDPLVGAAEPTASAPPTPTGKVSKSRANKRSQKKSESVPQPVALQIDEQAVKNLIEAYDRVRDGHSLDRVIVDPELNARLTSECVAQGVPGDARHINKLLFRLRKAGRLAGRETRHRTELTWEHCDPFLFASEIAWRKMIDAGADSLDDVLCDPFAAAEFDCVARRVAPGFSSLEYRWGALKLRKEANEARAHAQRMAETLTRLEGPGRLGTPCPLDEAATIEATPSGLYVVSGDQPDSTVYVGQALHLRDRLTSNFGDKALRQVWSEWAKTDSLFVRTFPADTNSTILLGYQTLLVQRLKPELNLSDWAAV